MFIVEIAVSRLVNNSSLPQTLIHNPQTWHAPPPLRPAVPTPIACALFCFLRLYESRVHAYSLIDSIPFKAYPKSEFEIKRAVWLTMVKLILFQDTIRTRIISPIAHIAITGS